MHPCAEQKPNKKDVNFYTVSQIQGGSSHSSQQPRAAHNGEGGVNRYFERDLYITPNNNYNLHKPDALYSQIKKLLHQHSGPKTNQIFHGITQYPTSARTYNRHIRINLMQTMYKQRKEVFENVYFCV